MKYQGFTLAESLAAAFVFIIFITSCLTLYINIHSTQRALSNFSLVCDDLSFTIERMSREIRMAYRFSSPNPNGGDEISFTNSRGENVTYKLNPSRKRIERVVNGESKVLTSENIEVEDLRFYLTGENTKDDLQPKVTISIKFKSTGGKESEKYEKTVQVSVSSRQLDMGL
ncbi:MAG: PilW family protein [Candidatus Helarchaeota archaeon]